MEIKSICVIGGGLMGRQIAMNTAIHGIKATVYDLNEAVCTAVEEWAEEYLAGRIAKGRMTEEQVAKIKSLFAVERDLNKAVSDVDLVIEAGEALEYEPYVECYDMNWLVAWYMADAA